LMQKSGLYQLMEIYCLLFRKPRDREQKKINHLIEAAVYEIKKDTANACKCSS
jgi:hypothetical protein